MHKFILALGLTVIVAVCSVNEGYAVPYNPGGSTSTGSSSSSSSSSGGVAPHVPAEEVSAGGGSGIDVKIGSDELQPVVDASIGGANAIIENLQNMAAQLLTGMAETSAQSVATGTGNATARAINSQGEAGASIVINNSGLAENACSFQTTLIGGNKSKSVAHENYMSAVSEDDGIIQGKDGTITENGDIDAAVKAYDTLICESPDGGSEENCGVIAGGAGYGILIGSANMDTLGVEVMRNAKKLQILNSTPLSIPDDVRESKTTDYKKLAAKIESLEYKLATATAMLEKFTSEVAQPGQESRDFPYKKEILEEGGIVSPAFIEALHPSNGQGSSYFANMESLITGLQNPNYFKEKAFTSEKGLMQSIMFNLNILNNTNFEMLKWLRQIGHSSALMLASEAEEDKKDVDPIVVRMRSGN